MSSTTENALRTTAELFNKELGAGDLRLWGRMLSGFSDMAVVWAFEQWDRNGKFFPKPAEILEHVHAFGVSDQNQVQYCGNCQAGWVVVNKETNEVQRCECVLDAIAKAKVPTHKCDATCKARHGKGYHTNDLIWLFKRYQRELAVNPKAKPEDFLDELDQRRSGGAPQWRVGGAVAQDWQNQVIRDEDIPF